MKYNLVWSNVPSENLDYYKKMFKIFKSLLKQHDLMNAIYQHPDYLSTVIVFISNKSWDRAFLYLLLYRNIRPHNLISSIFRMSIFSDLPQSHKNKIEYLNNNWILYYERNIAVRTE